jgi:hypothetical protein
VGSTRTTFTSVSPSVKYSFCIAESHGDRVFNWDVHGTVICEPQPDFPVMLHDEGFSGVATPYCRAVSGTYLFRANFTSP